MRKFVGKLFAVVVLGMAACFSNVAMASISGNCLNYSLSEQFDYLPEPLWMNRALDRNEARFEMSDATSRFLELFVQEMQKSDKKVYFVALPDTAQFMPNGTEIYGSLLGRFDDLYRFLNAQMEDIGFIPIDLMWLAERNRLTKDIHRNLDHHLLSRGRYLMAAQIARRMEGSSTLVPIHQVVADYDALPKESFRVWKPTALNFAIDACKSDIEKLPFDEYATLPTSKQVQDVSMNSLFGDSSDIDKIALLGTSQSLSAKGNLADFISYFSGTQVVNYSEAGGGSSTSVQFAAASGVLSDPAVKKIVWEVSTDFDSEKLAGSVLAGLGQASEVCRQITSFKAVGPVSGRFGDWIEIPSNLDGGYVLSLPNEQHSKGKVFIRFEFENQPPVVAEIWRWSQTQDPVSLGNWNVLVPKFKNLGLENPISIAVKFDGLYEYTPTGLLSLQPKVCDASGQRPNAG